MGISDVADLQHHSRYEEPQLIKEQMFNRRKSAERDIEHHTETLKKLEAGDTSVYL